MRRDGARWRVKVSRYRPSADTGQPEIRSVPSYCLEIGRATWRLFMSKTVKIRTISIAGGNWVAKARDLSENPGYPSRPVKRDSIIFLHAKLPNMPLSQGTARLAAR